MREIPLKLNQPCARLPKLFPHTLYVQAGDRVQTMNSSTITDVQGLQHHDAHVEQFPDEVEAEAADLKVPTPVNMHFQADQVRFPPI